ncbi:MAG: TrmH family RNA methyltransferase [Corynebacterium sp.]|nr:TrmH family RNA methyltransferase [Corynebacterium sp.]
MPSQQPEAAPGPTEWNEGRHGVGPWKEAHPGQPLPTGEHYDPELLAVGDRRNVVDAYRYWRREAIVADIDTRRHELHIAIENFENDANIGTVVRTANAFVVDTVHIVGRRRWNRRGAMVTDRYQHLRHHADTTQLLQWAKDNDLVVVAIDNTPGCVPLETVELPKRCLLLFGQEGPGVTQAAQEQAMMTCSIAQFGSTRSINAGVAAGIAMHAWIRQHADLSQAW